MAKAWAVASSRPPLDPLPDAAAVRRALEAAARDVIEVGTGLYDLPILCGVGGGDRLPAILITAGAHADETSGDAAAVLLLTLIETEHVLYVIPNRDPLGLEGFAKALSMACGIPEILSAAEEIEALLRQRSQLLVEDGSFLLGRIGDMGFATVRPTIDSFGSEKCLKIVQYHLARSPELARTLAFTRVLVPANAPFCEGRGTYERGYTAYATPDAFLGSYNRFFGSADAPTEVRSVQDFVDRVKPGLAIDLHEGWGNGFYWFVPPAGSVDPARADAVERGVQESLVQHGVPTSTLSELVPLMPEEHLARFMPLSHGRLTWHWPKLDESPWGVAFMPYCLRHGLAYQTEVGRWNPLENRVRYQVAAVRGAIQAFEQTIVAG